MGCLTSTQKEWAYIYVNTSTQQDNPHAIKHKLLLLGAGEGGKSTLLRQLRRLYGRDFSESELMALKPHLTRNVIEAMRTLAIYSEILHDQGHNTKVNEDNAEIRQRVAWMSDRQKFTREHCEDLTVLWNDYHIKNVLEFSHTFQLLDTCQYLFDQMHNYWRDEYIPTFEDLIHSRLRTTANNKIKIELSHASVNEIYEIFDVAGAKSERKTWIPILDDASIIIFVVALSGYNEVSWEDSTMNRMKEAIGLFRALVILNVFKGCNFIIFLNKYDLFCKKVGKYSVKKYFEDYTGSDDNEVEIINFFKQKFASQWIERPSRSKPAIRFYIGSATNTLCCKEIFELNQSIINYKLSVHHIKYVVRTWYEYNTCKQLNSFVNHSMTQIILSYIGKRIKYQ